MVLTACFVLSPETGFVASVDISVGISGPHDFAVRFRRIRLLRRKRPPHPAANVRDDRGTPLLWGRDRADSAGDLRLRSTLRCRGELARRANQAV